MSLLCRTNCHSGAVFQNQFDQANLWIEMTSKRRLSSMCPTHMLTVRDNAAFSLKSDNTYGAPSFFGAFLSNENSPC